MIEFNSIREHLNREMEHKYITKQDTRLVHFVKSFCNLFCFEKLEILTNNENVLFFYRHLDRDQHFIEYSY